MRAQRIRLITVLGTILLFSPTVHSQKGTGETKGIAQQGLNFPVATMTGKLVEVKTGPCEKSTGKVPIGTHLIVNSGERTLNLHLGPATAVDHVINQIGVGSTFSFDAFHTDHLPDNAYIVKSLTLEDKVIHLRDEDLRPSWAYERGHGKGRALRGPCW